MENISESANPLFKGIYYNNKFTYTKALVPGKVYGERIVIENNVSYREWNPFKSKYCATLKNGLKQNIFFSGAKVLYLGSAEGTTVSHVSDLVGKKGEIYCVDISEIAMQKLTALAEVRENLFPILGDAQKPKEYEEYLEHIDVLFQDVSQRNQTEIFISNARFLKKDSFGALSLKTKSISQQSKEKTLEEEKKKLSSTFEIVQVVSLEPFEKEHYLLLVKKR
jgi:fibrillarin-like pre-rRNA processing protein